MDFMPPPDNMKRFSLQWFRYNAYKHPNIFMICVPVPFLFYKFVEVTIRTSRGLEQGTYVPNVVMNRYAICRSTDLGAQVTPSRYLN